MVCEQCGWVPCGRARGRDVVCVVCRWAVFISVGVINVAVIVLQFL